MIELWLSSGAAGVILIPFVLLYLIAAGLVWLTHLSPARPFFASCIGIAGPFFASVAVLFSLFAAFLANDVQHVQAEANAAVIPRGRRHPHDSQAGRGARRVRPHGQNRGCKLCPVGAGQRMPGDAARRQDQRLERTAQSQPRRADVISGYDRSAHGPSGNGRRPNRSPASTYGAPDAGRGVEQSNGLARHAGPRCANTGCGGGGSAREIAAASTSAFCL